MSIANFGFQRSQRRNLMQKFNSFYYKASGLAAKGLDTLHMYGLGMCQKWVYLAIEKIAEQQNNKRNKLIATHPYVGVYDNLNVQFKSFQERLNSKTHFDSGTAGTLCIIHDPTAVIPRSVAYREHWLAGVRMPISAWDILSLEAQAAPRIRAQNIHLILHFLLNSPAFSAYEHKDDPILTRPEPIQQLPVGSEFTTDQYMLSTVHIEEASLEGNEKVLEEWFKQVRCLRSKVIFI